MRCETSFFSFTLYKKHLKRNWPLWAAHLALWLLALPVQIWNQHIYFTSHGNFHRFVHEHPLDCFNMLFPWLAFVAALVAVVVFFHLFKSNAANFVGALPLRREGVFLTAFAAGYTMLVGPLAVVALVTVAMEGLLGVLAPEILMFLGAAALNSFFWLSFAALCCVISGHAVAAVAFYFIFNWIVPVMLALVEGLLSGFLYGFAGFSAAVYEATGWLCPVMQLTSHNWTAGMGFDDWNMLAIYAAVGFLMCLAAVGLHHIRKAERSGDLIAFDPIKWLFKICVTVCGGMGLGTGLTLIVFNSMDISSDGWKFAVCCAAAAFVCYMVAEMLLARSFKVWKHWKGAVVSAVAFVLVVAAVDMDWIGFTTRVPEPSSVKSATATFGGSGVSTFLNNGLTFEEEKVKAITDLHQYLVDHQDLEYSGEEYYLTLRVNYKLGWTSLQRRYVARYAEGDELNRLLDAALKAGDISFPYQRGTPNYASLSLALPGTGEDNMYINNEILPEDMKALWEAVVADMSAGRYDLTTSAAKEEVNVGALYLEWAFLAGEGRERQYFELRLTPQLTETWKTLAGRDYLDPERQLGGIGTEVVE